MGYVLTVVDTVGIQRYIYGTNHLRQNVGASHIVKQATSHWVVDVLPGVHNAIRRDGQIAFNTSKRIEEGKLDAEVVYIGGGNAVILFASMELARRFAADLTRRALREAPGLHVVVAHSDPFDWEKSALGGKEGVVQRTMERLAQQKQNRPADAPLLGMGVTASGAFTGLPAVGREAGRLISSEAQAKIQAAQAAHEHLYNEFKEAWGEFGIPKDFDHFGRSEGERSYVAVIHIDVNGMGKRVQAVYRHYPTPEDNRAYIEAMRAFSQSMKDAAHTALESTIRLLARNIDKLSEEYGINLEEDDGRVYLPVRPIVYGGDDVTFVTDGRLGLSLAARYIRVLAQQHLVGPEGEAWPIYARGGIAIVKTHYPFAHAYTLTEELNHSAKVFIQEQRGGQDDLNALDWHFTASGLIGGLKEIRQREYYLAREYSLLMRPVVLDTESKEYQGWRTWSNFVKVTCAFKYANEWRDRRNKIKALREVLRQGNPEAIEHFRSLYRIPELPPIKNAPPDVQKRGWLEKRTPYFDAIEAIDFFISLEKESLP